jgi:hypothetical protein
MVGLYNTNNTITANFGESAFQYTTPSGFVSGFSEPGLVDVNKKIAVTTSNGTTQCYTEIERWDSTNEEAYLWVKAPELMSGLDTTLYLYYDNTQLDNTTYIGEPGDAVAQNVWDSDFEAVWHMANDPETGTDAIKDSTSNGNNGTSAGSMTYSDLINGKTGKAITFDGSDDYINVGNIYSSPIGSGTIEVVFRTVDTRGGFISQDAAGWNNLDTSFGVGQQNASAATNGHISFETHGPGASAERNVESPIAYNDNDWYNTVATWNSTQYELFVDGVSKDTETTSYGAWGSDGSTNINIGTAQSERYAGPICELRLSNIARSDVYIKANYYNMWDDFITFGSIEDRPHYYFSGYTQLGGINTGPRTIYAYRRDTGERVGYTTSSGNGSFILETTYSGEHFVVGIDDVAGPDYNDKAVGKVIPYIIP